MCFDKICVRFELAPHVLLNVSQQFGYFDFLVHCTHRNKGEGGSMKPRK